MRRGVDLPRNLLYRLTTPSTIRSRRWKFDYFMDHLRPTSSDRILDVGVCHSSERAGNFFEMWYPWRERITAVSLDPVPLMEEAFPEVRFVQADGRNLPFEDHEFDFGFSNAVIEHVGDRTQQERFASELLRTCKVVFVTTPNRWFPVDPHTLFPVVHWLPPTPRGRIYRLLGRPGWASVDDLNPLSAQSLRSVFANAARVEVVRQRMGFMTSNLAVVASTG